MAGAGRPCRRTARRTSLSTTLAGRTRGPGRRALALWRSPGALPRRTVAWLTGPGQRPRGATAHAAGRPRRPCRGFCLGASPLLGLALADGGDALGNRDLEARVGPRRVVEVGQLDARQPLADDLLDQVPLAFFLARDERERLAGGLGPTRAADTVDVVLGRDRHVEVHDMAQFRHVDATGGDVGRDEHRVLPALEPGQRQRALRLRPVAMDARGLDALPLEVRRQAIGAVLGPREHQRLRHHAARQQRREQGALQVLRHRVDRLRDADGGRGLARQVDRRRVVEEFAGQADDRRRHRGAEEQGLAPAWAGA